MNKKYTQEETDDITKAYTESPTRATVNSLAEKYDRPVRSIVGKLSKEGIYIKPTYLSKTGEIPVNKDEIVEFIAKAMSTPSTNLEGLEKAPKGVLRLILAAIDPQAKKYFVNDI
jgi:hypothetical protein